MKFIRFGKRCINMDMVQEVQFMPATSMFPECYRLYVNQTVDGTLNYLEVEGVDMIAFELWLNRNAEDCTSAVQVISEG